MMTLSKSVAWFVVSVINYQLESWMAETTDESLRSRTIYALVGKSVAIPCHAYPSSRKDALALILWYKDNDTTPLYSLDARQGKLEQARHATRDLLTERAFLDVLTEPATLTLESVRVKDEGEYKCRADFKNERTRYSSIALNVVVEPQKPLIKDTTGEILQSLVGPYNEGESLLLICEVKGGKPFPSLTWWRETVLLDKTYELLATNTVRNELQINSLKRHDLMAVFTCKANNNNITESLTSSVTIDMNCSVFVVRPLSVSIDGEEWEMKADQQVELTCRAIGSRPPALLTWRLGTKLLKSTNHTVSVDGNITKSLLSFTPSKDDNGVHLACRAENTLIVNSAIEYGRMLDVRFTPCVSLKHSGKPHRAEIMEGKDVYLDCEIESNPPFSQLAWKYEGRKLKSNRTKGIIISNQTLIIQKVHRSNSGKYECIATNSQGTKESDPFILIVQYIPECTHQETLAYRGIKDESVKVSCEVNAEPEPLAFRWKVNTSVDTGQLVTVINDGPRSIATYIPNSDAEFGIIECWGKNSIGEQVIPCTYTVLPADPPEKIKECSATNRTETGFVVHCLGRSSDGISQVFVMEVHNTLIGKLVLNYTSDIGILLARNLTPGTNYSAKIYSSNSVGKSKPIILDVTTLQWRSSLTRKAESSENNFRLEFLVPIIISTVLTMSVCLAIIILKTRQKISKRRREANSNLNEKCQSPVHKDSNEERKSCTYISDEKGPDIIPEIKDSSLSDDVIEGDIFTMDIQKDTEKMDQIKCKMKTPGKALLPLSPTNRSPSSKKIFLQNYLSSPSKSICSSVSSVVYTKQTKV